MSETPASTSSSEPRSYPQGFFVPPPGACQIILVRHGQSAPYVEGTPFPMIDGQGDPPLSERGEWQADRVAERLREEPIEALYCSTLQRTQQTAAPLASALGLEPSIVADLREVHLGEGEGGVFRRMAAEGHPAVLRMRERGEWGEIPGAETTAQLQDRTVTAVRSIAAAHAEQVVAVFCHGGVIAALLAHAVGRTDFTFGGARNASFNHIVVGASDTAPWIIRSFNDAAHTGMLTADADPPT